MSLLSTMLIPLLLSSSDPWEYRPRGLYDLDRFGLGITTSDLKALEELRKLSISPRLKSELERSTIGKDGFQVLLDVQQFKPNEITVKTIDNDVIVEGKHEERQDEHGLISRHFIRKYTLPRGYNPKEVVSTLSSDGILTVKAPPPKEALENERIVQIQQTGPAHLNVKENPQEEKKESEKKDPEK